MPHGYGPRSAAKDLARDIENAAYHKWLAENAEKAKTCIHEWETEITGSGDMVHIIYTCKKCCTIEIE